MSTIDTKYINYGDFIDIDPVQFTEMLSALERWDKQQVTKLIVGISNGDFSQPYNSLIQIKADRQENINQAMTLVRGLLNNYKKDHI